MTTSTYFDYVNNVLHEKLNVIFKRTGYNHGKLFVNGLYYSVGRGQLEAVSYYGLDQLAPVYRNNFIGKYMAWNCTTPLEYLPFDKANPDNKDKSKLYLFYDFVGDPSTENHIAMCDAMWHESMHIFIRAYENCIQDIFVDAYSDHVHSINPYHMSAMRKANAFEVNAGWNPL